MHIAQWAKDTSSSGDVVPVPPSPIKEPAYLSKVWAKHRPCISLHFQDISPSQHSHYLFRHSSLIPPTQSSWKKMIPRALVMWCRSHPTIDIGANLLSKVWAKPTFKVWANHKNMTETVGCYVLPNRPQYEVPIWLCICICLVYRSAYDRTTV